MEYKGKILKIKYFNAMDGAPILDIKPFFKEVHPKGEIKQPIWVADVIKNYWKQIN